MFETKKKKKKNKIAFQNSFGKFQKNPFQTSKASPMSKKLQNNIEGAVHKFSTSAFLLLVF